MSAGRVQPQGRAPVRSRLENRHGSASYRAGCVGPLAEGDQLVLRIVNGVTFRLDRSGTPLGVVNVGQVYYRDPSCTQPVLLVNDAVDRGGLAIQSGADFFQAGAFYPNEPSYYFVSTNCQSAGLAAPHAALVPVSTPASLPAPLTVGSN